MVYNTTHTQSYILAGQPLNSYINNTYYNSRGCFHSDTTMAQRLFSGYRLHKRAPIMFGFTDMFCLYFVVCVCAVYCVVDAVLCALYHIFFFLYNTTRCVYYVCGSGRCCIGYGIIWCAAALYQTPIRMRCNLTQLNWIIRIRNISV